MPKPNGERPPRRGVTSESGNKPSRSVEVRLHSDEDYEDDIGEPGKKKGSRGPTLEEIQARIFLDEIDLAKAAVD